MKWVGIKLLLVSAAIASPAHAEMDPDAPRIEIRISPANLPETLAGDTSGLVRDARIVASNKVPPSNTPLSILNEERDNGALIKMMVEVAADDRLASCEPIQMSRWIKGEALAQTADPSIGSLACELTIRYASGRHAADQQGKAVTGKTAAWLEFSKRTGGIFRPAPIMQEMSWVTRAGGARLSRFWQATDVTVAAPPWRDYLTVQQKLEREVVAGVVLSVAPDGSADSCEITQTSGIPAIDTASCNGLLAQHHSNSKRFKLDYPLRLHWSAAGVTMQLPVQPVLPLLLNNHETFPTVAWPAGDPPKAPQPGASFYTVQMEVLLDGEGRITNCKVLSSSFNDAWAARSCEVVRQNARFAAARDEFGNSASGGMFIQFNWENFRLWN